jgi:hypothetical protein
MRAVYHPRKGSPDKEDKEAPRGHLAPIAQLYPPANVLILSLSWVGYVAGMTQLTGRALMMLESPVSAYRGWRPEIACGGRGGKICHGLRTVMISDLNDRYGEQRLSDLIPQLRCDKCGGRAKGSPSKCGQMQRQ